MLARLETLIECEEIAVERVELEAARLQAGVDQRRAVVATLEHEQARRETLTVGRALAQALAA